jgi:uncharacterized membrane protein YdjX (TVP38/TMEM64 family)
MTKHRNQLALLALFIGLVIALRLSPLGSALTFENLKAHREELLALVRGHSLASAAVFVAGYIVFTALSAPGAIWLSLAGGFLFGALPAALLIVISATIGASLSFLIARHLLGNRLQERYSAQLAAFNREMHRNGARYLLSLRLIPLFPFFLVNFLSGLTNVTLRTFLWTTAFGIIPGAAVFAYAGAQLGTISSPSEILSPRVLTAFAALAALALFPAAIDRIKAFKNRQR